MKILLDENLPRKLQVDLGPENEVRTVGDMDWNGKKNGELLGLMVTNGFEGFVTIDKNGGGGTKPAKGAPCGLAFCRFLRSLEQARLAVETTKGRQLRCRPFAGFCRDERIRTSGLWSPRPAL